MKDSLVTCNRCKGNACYETDHTFSNGLNIKSYQCMGCGFTTNSTLVEGSNELANSEAQLPELYKDLKFVDQNNHAWFPCVININEQGMVFANGNSKENWGWAAVKAMPVPENEKTKFPIPGLSGRFYQYKSDMSTLTMFSPKDFMDACDFINLFEK